MVPEYTKDGSGKLDEMTGPAEIDRLASGNCRENVTNVSRTTAVDSRTILKCLTCVTIEVLLGDERTTMNNQNVAIWC